MNKYFVEVPINGPEDLPKEEGKYIVRSKYGDTSNFTYIATKVKKKDWLDNIASYLLPVELGVLYEKVSVENELPEEGYHRTIGNVQTCYFHADRKEWDQKENTNITHWLRPIQ